MKKIKLLIVLAFLIQITSPTDFVYQLKKEDHSYHFDYMELFSNINFIDLDDISPECTTDLQHITNAVKNKISKINDTFWDKVMGSREFFF